MERRPGWRRGGALVCVLAVLGCAGPRGGAGNQPLSQSQALALAVELANQECQAKFSAAPFDTASYPIRYESGSWQWGGLDLAGPGGMSASVSFDVYGQDRHVEAYLSTDGLQGMYGTDSTRVRVRRP